MNVTRQPTQNFKRICAAYFLIKEKLVASLGLRVIRLRVLGLRVLGLRVIGQRVFRLRVLGYV